MTEPQKPATHTRTSTNGVDTPPSSDTEKNKNSNPRQDFLIAAANMSWQLAIVVLVPLLVGYRIDRHFHTLPLWTGVGFVVAMIGMALVVWRQLQLLSPTISDTKGGKK